MTGEHPDGRPSVRRSVPAAARGVPGPSVSAAVCTRRRPQALSRCLAALRRQRYPRRELVVIDNGGDASVEEVARAYGARYVVERRAGIRLARNRAIAVARGDIVAFTDDDCEPEPGWLAAIAREFARDPALACCTGPIRPAALETSSQRLLEGRGGYSRGAERHEHDASSEPNAPGGLVQAWRYGSGGNMAFCRLTIEQLGGFDEDPQGAEDLEMFFRIQRHGYRLAYAPEVAVRHHHVRDRRALRRRLYGWGAGYIAFLLKVALGDQRYARAAELEIGNWFRYQLRHRARDALSGRYPLDLYAAELAGGGAALLTAALRRPAGRGRRDTGAS